MRDGRAEELLLVGSVQIDVTGSAVDGAAPVDAVFQAIKPKDTRKNQICVATRPPFRRRKDPSLHGAARDEHLAEGGIPP